MNILILNWRDRRHPKHGGAEYVTHEHAKRWVKGGNTVIWYSASFDGGRPAELIDGIHIIRKGTDVTVFFHAMIYVLSHRKQIDCIVDEVHGIPFFSVLYTRTPVVVFIHEIAGCIWDYMYPFPIARIGKMLEILYLRIYRLREFWTVSLSTSLELQANGIDRNHITVIPNPIGCTPVSSLPRKEKHPTFLFVGRLVPMKRVHDVITAFVAIQKEKLDAVLWIVGEGTAHYVSSLKTRIRSLGIGRQVRFFGRVDENHKLRLMKNAHILLHASVKEGWGLVVLEAASQGTPSIVYDVAGLRDAVAHNKTGIVVPDADTQQMATQAVKLISDTNTYRMLQLNGLTRVRESNWNTVATKSEAMLKRIVEKAKSMNA